MVFGTWLVDEAGLDFGEAWLTISYVVWALATATGAFVLGPHGRRVARQAAQLRLNGVRDSEELRSEAGKPVIAVLGNLQLVFILALLFLMTMKPGA
jgi:uncharacterized membrane protein